MSRGQPKQVRNGVSTWSDGLEARDTRPGPRAVWALYAFGTLVFVAVIAALIQDVLDTDRKGARLLESWTGLAIVLLAAVALLTAYTRAWWMPDGYLSKVEKDTAIEYTKGQAFDGLFSSDGQAITEPDAAAARAALSTSGARQSIERARTLWGSVRGEGDLSFEDGLVAFGQKGGAGRGFPHVFVIHRRKNSSKYVRIEVSRGRDSIREKLAGM